VRDALTPVRLAALAGAGVALAAALSPPLQAAAEERLAAHMVQHLALLLLAAPLLAFALPLAGGACWRPPLWPVLVEVAAIAVLWLWHLPAAYESAVRNHALHAAEHATLLATAAAFWWMLRAAAVEGAHGGGIAALFLAAVQGGILGGLLTFAPTPIYPSYTSLADQQLAGTLMWVPAAVVYVAAAAVLFAGWLQAAEQRSG
jgi:putative membrane protein